jgi:hypothetical protein
MPQQDFLLEQLREAHTWLKAMVIAFVSMAAVFAAFARFMYSELKDSRAETKEANARSAAEAEARREDAMKILPVLDAAVKVTSDLTTRRSRR